MSRVFYVLVFLLLISKSVVSVPSCAEVVRDLSPCLKFLQGKDVTPQCCSGLKNLAAIAKTKADRVASCDCGKQALSHFDYDPKRFPLLPKKCGVDYNMPAIDKNFNCSKVELKHLS
ncbi:non-specific lipid-transfer protein-like [Sesamum indicum]|uniref:Non-specific lipid-transfer protein n=1 Tax=Sesamum indicum TaxID=4182 RepID=A0A6I9U133_SESIN|nr:non-specific lipid-transfer protein-like [Sesamum indicum]